MNSICHLTDDDWRELADHLQLTPREVDIVQGLLQGQNESGVGRALGISTNTVHTHLGRIYKKLEVNSIAGLIRCVFSAYIRLVRESTEPSLRAGERVD